MGGTVKFQDALESRLNLLQPSKSQIQACLEAHPLELTPGIEQLMKALKQKSVDIFLVSG